MPRDIVHIFEVVPTVIHPGAQPVAGQPGLPRVTGWTVHFTDDLGAISGHTFPWDTFAWRAAEYDLDLVADFDAILDMVLMEPWMDPADHADPVRLHAPGVSRAQAKAAHLARVARTKARMDGARPGHLAKNAAHHARYAPPAGTDPLDVLRTQHGCTRQDVAERVRRLWEPAPNLVQGEPRV